MLTQIFHQLLKIDFSNFHTLESNCVQIFQHTISLKGIQKVMQTYMKMIQNVSSKDFSSICGQTLLISIYMEFMQGPAQGKMTRECVCIIWIVVSFFNKKRMVFCDIQKIMVMHQKKLSEEILSR